MIVTIFSNEVGISASGQKKKTFSFFSQLPIMPRDKREGRTRGKRGKKEKNNQEEVLDEGFENAESNEPMQPMVVDQDPNGYQQDSHNFERPRGYDPSQAFFGFLDADVQQYFKNVEQTLDDPPFETTQG
jgi:nucleolar protein 9